MGARSAGRRLLVHLPEPWRTSRVWRSRTADEEEAEALISETISEVRASGWTRLIWHTGDGVAPPFVDVCLAKHGFQITEELEVLAFELGRAPEPELPRLAVPAGVSARLARDAEDLREVLRIWSEVFSTPAPSGREVSEFAEELGELERRQSGTSTNDGPLAFRTLAIAAGDGTTGRDAIASAGAQVVGETLRLWGAGTLRPYRGRGAYRALVLERRRVAHALGASLALTKANAGTSAPILTSAGFRPIARERHHALDPS